MSSKITKQIEDILKSGNPLSVCIEKVKNLSCLEAYQTDSGKRHPHPLLRLQAAVQHSGNEDRRMQSASQHLFQIPHRCRIW